MDEPTSSLTPSEFERLAEVIAELASTGVSIIYVSHKMDEVFKVCSRATIMRDGQLVGEVDLRETTEAAVVCHDGRPDVGGRRAPFVGDVGNRRCRFAT